MGMRVNAVITWTQLELKGLLEDEDSHVRFERARRHLGLHPFHLTDLNAALREILSSSLNRHDAKLNGIILSYKNPKLISRTGEMIHDACYIHIDIESDFYVFRPEVGVTLKGIVNKKSKDHVGILVHKAFNVSIPRPDDDEDWPGHDVRVGQEVRFTVTYLDFKGRLPYIRGSLDKENYLEGCKPFNLKVEVEDDTEVKPKENKIVFDDDGEAISTPGKESNKSKNKRRTFGSDDEENIEQIGSPIIREKIKNEPDDTADEVSVVKSNNRKNKVKVEIKQISEESDIREANIKSGKRMKNKGKSQSVENVESPLGNVTVKIELDSDENVPKKKSNKRYVDDELDETNFMTKKKKKKMFETTTNIASSTRLDDSSSEINERTKSNIQALDSSIIAGHLQGFVKKPKKKHSQSMDEVEVVRKIKKEKVTSDDSSMETSTKVKSSKPTNGLNDLVSKQSKRKRSIEPSEMNISTENEIIQRVDGSPQKNRRIKSLNRKSSIGDEEIVVKKKKKSMSHEILESSINHNDGVTIEKRYEKDLNDVTGSKVKKSKSSGAVPIEKDIYRKQKSKSESSSRDLDTSIVKIEATETKKKKSKFRNESALVEEKIRSKSKSPTKSDELQKAKAKYEKLTKEIKKKAAMKVQESD